MGLTLSSKIKRYIYERRGVLYFAITVMLVLTLPYLLGYATQGDGWHFTGFLFGVEDGNHYIAKMLGGAEGAWLFRSAYTAYPQKGVLAYLPFILLGKLTSSPGQHEQSVALFHIFRIVAGVLAIIASYDFIALFIKTKKWRWWSLVLITLGGGLGWILIILGQQNWLGSMPLEFYSPESFGFLELYGLPHLALGRALLLWGMLYYLSPIREQGIRYKVGLKTGVLWLLLGLLQPLFVVLAWAVIGMYLVLLGIRYLYIFWRGQGRDWQVWWLYFWRAVTAILVSCPIAIYTFLTFTSDPYMKGWTIQNIILSPHPLHYLIAYGLLLPYAILGMYHIFAKGEIEGILITGWLILLPILIYLPYNPQRRLAESVWAALVILSVKLVESWQDSKMIIRRTLLFKSMVILLLPSTTLLYLGGLIVVSRPAEPLYRPRDEVAVFDFLNQHAKPDEVVLSSYDTGNVLPAWSHVRVVIGHGVESVDLARLNPRVTAFYEAATSDTERIGFIRNFNIHYIYWGPNERSLAIKDYHQPWDPTQANYLKEINRSGDYAVFEVIK